MYTLSFLRYCATVFWSRVRNYTRFARDYSSEIMAYAQCPKMAKSDIAFSRAELLFVAGFLRILSYFTSGTFFFYLFARSGLFFGKFTYNIFFALFSILLWLLLLLLLLSRHGVRVLWHTHGRIINSVRSCISIGYRCGDDDDQYYTYCTWTYLGICCVPTIYNDEHFRLYNLYVWSTPGVLIDGSERKIVLLLFLLWLLFCSLLCVLL